MQIPTDHLERLLSRVQKPARYAGGEWNAIRKDWRGIRASIALAYPDVYEIGMSNLGLAILYDLINRVDDFVAERVYAPWDDMAAALRAANIPLYSLETRRPLFEFDVVGFSLQHELTYTNVLEMLDLAHIPLLAEERDASMPLIIGGGSCTYNPEPLAPFFDLFVIGEGEEVTLELLEAIATWKDSPHAKNRSALLQRLAQIPGIYVPSLYKVAYHADGTVKAILPLCAKVPPRVRKRIVPALPPAPTRLIVPTMGIVHDRAAIEIQRGCSRGCRFCQAGMIYRPIRERPVHEVLDAVDAIIAATGYEEIGLVSLSSSDHSGIRQIVQGILERHAEDGLAVSLPSLRIDSFSVELAQLIQQYRKTGFTFAPEAGSQRLRDVINKGVTEEDLFQTAEAVFANGWNRIKLYFMLGLPTETDEDALEIVRLVREIERLGRQIRQRRIEISVSVATFVPKPHTPFQWLPLAPREEVETRQSLLAQGLRSRHIQLSWPDWESTWLEALLSRGDRRLAPAIRRAWELGAHMDAWSERFQPNLWQRALAECAIDQAFYTTRQRDREEILPWSHIDTGLAPEFLWREYERALKGIPSPDCRRTCHGCGISSAFAQERGASDWGCP